MTRLVFTGGGFCESCLFKERHLAAIANLRAFAMDQNRRLEYLHRAAQCEDRAAMSGTRLSWEVWREAAAAWRELAEFETLLGKIEQLGAAGGPMGFDHTSGASKG